ncbi:hypothetical protein [Priestia megaterium]|uniref:hypothetical protein n=1 Tax=Priestia megaterium TaxID=1404 RepID=UPI001A93FCDA|nr:hypothetical protein [Priestia megaterium]QSX24492.1 hypothetical protein J0P05_33040 [Priestia megaterium]
MQNTIKFEERSELLSYLTNQLKFRSYALEEGFEEFENKTLASSGSSTSDAVNWEVFDWRDENENDVTIEIAFISNPLDEESTKFEDYYLVWGNTL